VIVNILRSDLPTEFGIADLEAVHAAKASALGFTTREQCVSVIMCVSHNVFVEMEKVWSAKYMHWFIPLTAVSGLTNGMLCGLHFVVGEAEAVQVTAPTDSATPSVEAGAGI
jgi:hypothetical protein